MFIRIAFRQYIEEVPVEGSFNWKMGAVGRG